MVIVQRQTFSPEETAEILGKPTRTIRRWLRDGTLRGIKLQRSWMIPQAEIERLLGHSLSQGNVIQSSREEDLSETFRKVCASRGEDSDAVIKNLMVEYVRAVEEAKAQEASREPDGGRQKMPKRKPKVII